MTIGRYGKSVLMLGALLWGISGASAEEMRKVRLGSDGVYPPWNYKDASGTQTGYEVDLANDLCQRAKVTCEWTFQACDGLIPALNEDRFDVLMVSLGITASREKAIDFSIQYYAGPHLFVASTQSDFAKAQASNAGMKLRMEELDDQNKSAYEQLKAALAGKSVGVERGVKYVDFLKQWFPEVTVRQYDKSEAIYLDLQAGPSTRPSKVTARSTPSCRSRRRPAARLSSSSPSVRNSGPTRSAAAWPWDSPKARMRICARPSTRRSMRRLKTARSRA